MSTQSRRLAAGGRIDRDRLLRFTFDGKAYAGHPGDTLASALLANDVSVAGRSFKYHRPRGIMAAGAEESNALVQVGEGKDARVNLRATEVELYDGLVARAVNCWPSAAFDLGAVNNLAGRFLAAGFYYKTFMWPHWHLYEWAIRKAAGLGKPSAEPDPERYEHRFAHCDVLVVGAGPAGLAAAKAAAGSGARVILCEQDSELGGSLLWDEAGVDGISGSAWAREAEAFLAAQPETRILQRTTAIGYFDHNALALLERRGIGQRLWQVRAKRVVLATGALERPLVFPGNDRPGVMLAGAVHQYLVHYAVLPGRSAVLFTNNDGAYAVAEALAAAGASATIVDMRAAPGTGLAQRMATLGIALRTGSVIIRTHGRPALGAVTVRDANGRQERVACDLLAMSGGFNPTLHLFCQSGGVPVYDEARAMFVPGPSVQAEESVGAAAGVLDIGMALLQAHEAGARAASATGFTATAAAPVAAGRPAPSIEPCWSVEGKRKAFVDFLNDVTADDIALAARENFVSIEHLKRYTTLGMAPDQGKTSNVNALAIMAELTGKSVAAVGTTRYRFPYTPTPLGAFAGRARGELFRPVRRLPAHDWHGANGAVFEEYGEWLRPAWYRHGDETAHEAEQREAMAVRERVGLFEASPLGKIHVVGPDAGMFLDRVYANKMSTLKAGRCRYGLMLSELGVPIDDGVTARLGQDHFLVGTTGAGAGRIAGWLDEWRQCEWPDLDVLVAPVTTASAVLTLSGPEAREVLAAAGIDIPLSRDEFPHMSFRSGTVAGYPARVFRVSFTGELSYEINVPASAATGLWARLMGAGGPFEIEPVGVDAWMLLRTEKGYLHIGADTDGATSAQDIGWSRVLKRADDFIGKRSLFRPDSQRPDRLQFVGLEALGTREALPIGAPIAAGEGMSQGYVTSSGLSPVLGRGVALGMLRNGTSRVGETVSVITGEGRQVCARVTVPCAYDSDGERLNA